MQVCDRILALQKNKKEQNNAVIKTDYSKQQCVWENKDQNEQKFPPRSAWR